MKEDSIETDSTSMRLDKWLWAARFYKTRSLAAEEILKGRLAVNGQAAKPARALRVGDEVEIREAGLTRTLTVRGLSALRGPASSAQLLYVESELSIARRQQARQDRNFGVEPGISLEHGRPTKRDRRELADWQRWSASAED